MIASLAQPLPARRLAALVSLALAACGGDASDVAGPVTPAPRLSEVRVSPATAEVAVGGTLALSASPRDGNGRPMGGVSIAWRSLDAQVATVDAAGQVTGGALGTARIVASASGFADTAQITVRASTTPGAGVASLSIDPGDVSLRPGTTGTLTAILRDAQNEPVNATVTWTSENEAIVRVSATGTITAVAKGKARVLATAGSQTGIAVITVADMPPPVTPVARVVVSPSSPTVAVGAELTLAATPQNASGATVTGRVVTWTSANASVATVSAAGVVRGVAAGSTTITARVDNVTQPVTVTVTAPAAGVQAVTRGAAEHGTVARDDQGEFELPGLLLVGDDDEFGVDVLQGFVSYSLAGIPAGAQIQGAQLGVTMDAFGVFGSPFSLGGLYVERATTLSLNEGAVGSGSVLVASALTPNASANVADLVRAALAAGETSIIFRFRFVQPGNDDGSTDQLELTAGSLAITYVP